MAYIPSQKNQNWLIPQTIREKKNSKKIISKKHPSLILNAG